MIQYHLIVVLLLSRHCNILQSNINATLNIWWHIANDTGNFDRKFNFRLDSISGMGSISCRASISGSGSILGRGLISGRNSMFGSGSIYSRFYEITGRITQPVQNAKNGWYRRMTNILLHNRPYPGCPRILLVYGVIGGNCNVDTWPQLSRVAP